MVADTSGPARVLIPSALDDLPQLPAADAGIWTFSGASMGTTWAVKLVPDAGSAYEPLSASIQRVLDRVVAQMSTWLPQSELCCYNAAPAGTSMRLSESFAVVLQAALQLAADTGGAYDPTAAPLVDLWGFGPAPRRHEPPDPAAIAAARKAVGWHRLPFDPRSRRVTQPGGLRLDLSSIAKGYGVDEICKALRRQGITHFLVEIGGELKGLGCKPDGMPWWVELERATGETLAPLRIALHGLAVATSGDAQQHFALAGRRYSHTLDPRSGRPVSDELASVTVLHRECMQADALATAISVLGIEAGFEYARGRDVAARLVFRAGSRVRERLTPAFAAMLV